MKRAIKYYVLNLQKNNLDSTSGTDKISLSHVFIVCSTIALLSVLNVTTTHILSNYGYRNNFSLGDLSVIVKKQII